jgi:4-methylaminobutanoate oxidase (formaldehyde-forming)
MDRLADKNLAAASFDHTAGPGRLPGRARTVVVGGGIAGASVAYHLAVLGDPDVLVLESHTLGSGTSWHAAGLVSKLRSTPAMTELAGYGVGMYRDLQAETSIDISFRAVGSLILARTEGRVDELRHLRSVARAAGVESELLSSSDVVRHWPLASTARLLGGLHISGDGHLNPGHLALAFAKGAAMRGVILRENVRVTGISVIEGRVVGVTTTLGEIECERVVLACGIWTRDLAATADFTVPLYAAEHVHVRTTRIEGLPPGLAVLRDLDGYFYARTELDRLLVGSFEPDGRPRAMSTLPPGPFVELQPDRDHFAQIRAAAELRIPALVARDYDRFLTAPESFTPDGAFCLGEAPETAGLFVAAGFNSQGVILGAGAGRALADWIISGAPGFDSSAVDVRRFVSQQGNRRYLHARTRESLGRLYAMHWPHLQPATARNVRRTALHDRVAAAGACFGETAGWERADWYGDSGSAPEYGYSFRRQNWFHRVAEEHRAAREGVVLFDLGSFAKFEIRGPDALDVMQIACTADLDVDNGKVVYTLMLNSRGGIDVDATVTRLGPERFLAVAPAAYQTRTSAILGSVAAHRAATVIDVTSGLGTIGVMGPRSRELLERISPEDWSTEAQGYTWARDVEIADGHALSVRVSFVGELGYELYPPVEQVVNIYDSLVEAGVDLDLRHAGYLALDSLRIEKGFRHLGHDIGPDTDPWSAGLGFTVATTKATPFVGREAALRAKEEPRPTRMVHLILDDPEATLLPDQAIVMNGRPIGRVTSAAYGYTLGRAVGIGKCPTDLPDGSSVAVDGVRRHEEARVSYRPFYDPSGSRLRI